jgi:Superinfection immunity protein
LQSEGAILARDLVHGGVLLLVVAVVYFVPTIIAYSRGHHQRAAICVTNVFLGWSGLGWIAALIWSATAVVQQAVVALPAAQLPDARPRRDGPVGLIVLALILATFALVWVFEASRALGS